MRISAALLSALCLSGTALAAATDTYGIGSRATALGGAFTATADDPYAVYYNPAGLVRIDQPTLSIGTIAINPDIQFDYDDGVYQQRVQDDSGMLFAPHLAYAHPINARWTFGFGFYLPHAIDIKWPTSYPDNAASTQATRLRSLREVIAPTLAYQVSDRLSLGAGINIGRSEILAEKTIAISTGNNVVGGMLPGQDIVLGKFRQELDGYDWSWNIGLLWEATESIDLGLTYRSRTKVDMEGTTRLEGPWLPTQNVSVASPPYPAPVVPASAVLNQMSPLMATSAGQVDASHQSYMPEQVQLGLAWQATADWRMEADLVWTAWSRKEVSRYTYSDAFGPAALSYGNDGTWAETPRNWDDTWQLKLGTEYRLKPGHWLRAGYYYDPSPVPDETFDIMFPDGDKQIFSIGSGHELGEHWLLDTVLLYGMTTEDRDIFPGESENTSALLRDDPVSVKGDGSILGLGLTVSYRF